MKQVTKILSGELFDYEITYIYSGVVVIDNDGEENRDNVALDGIEIDVLNPISGKNGLVETLFFDSLDELYRYANEQLYRFVANDEESAYQEYCEDERNQTTSAEYYADSYDEGER